MTIDRLLLEDGASFLLLEDGSSKLLLESSTAGASVNAGVGALEITGYAPTVNVTYSVSTGLGALEITGYEPTVGVGYNITAGVGALEITGYAPTVTATANVWVNPDTGALVITGYEPTANVGGSFTALPGLAELILQGYAPSVANSTPSEEEESVTRATKRLLRKRRSRDELTEALAMLKVELAKKAFAKVDIPATPEALLSPPAEVREELETDDQYIQALAIERSLEKSRSKETLAKITRKLIQLEEDLEDEMDFSEFIEYVSRTEREEMLKRLKLN